MKSKNRSAIRTVGCFHMTALRFNKTLHDGQPKTRSSRFRIWSAMEQVKDSIQLILRNARSAVCNLYNQMTTVSVRGDLDRRSCRCVRNGVRDQVGQYLFHQNEIHFY